MPQRNLHLHLLSIQQAKENNIATYFTGKPCKHGHISIRRVDSGCRECMLAKLKRRKKSHTKKRPFVLVATNMHGPFTSLSVARKLGLKLYSTGRHCSNGHISPSLTRKQSCVECTRLSNIEYRRKNKKSRSDYNKWHYKDNIDKIKVYAKKYGKENPEKRNHHTAVRRSKLKKALPAWADLALVKKVYKNAKLNGFEVDHKVPLVSDFVCGLHWHINLEPIPSSDNRKKGNRYWPNMSDTNDQELLKMVEEFKKREPV